MILLKLPILDEDDKLLDTIDLSDNAIVLVRDIFDIKVGPGFTIGFDQPCDFLNSAKQKVEFDPETELLIDIIGGGNILLDTGDTAEEDLKKIDSIINDLTQAAPKYDHTLNAFIRIRELLVTHGVIKIDYD